jgi:ethanolamine ammonia-lyase small subunit
MHSTCSKFPYYQEKKSKQLGFSGVNLKDEHQLSNIDFAETQKLLF